VSRTAIIVAQVIAALLALGGIYFSLLMQVMQPSSTAADIARLVALGAVVVLTLIGVSAARKGAVAVATTAVILTLGAGAVPGFVYEFARAENAQRAEARRRSENAAHDAKALARIERRTRDVEARLAENRPYAGKDAQDALEFVNEVSYVDLKYLGLPDRSGVMLDLLRRALEVKLIDPNIMVKGSRPGDVDPVPLFLEVYRDDIRRYPNASVNPRNWATFKLLVANGADLTLAPGHPIAEDLSKGLTQDQWGNYRLP
jgi:hypothetical protein